MQKIDKVQLGKNGLTESFIENLKELFKNTKNIKISVLKGARGEGKEAKEKVREYSEKILEGLGNKYSSRVIGFTISIKKWKNAVR